VREAMAGKTMRGQSFGRGYGAGRGGARGRNPRRSVAALVAGLAGSWLKRHPGGVLTGLVFLGAATAISVNALTLQDAPHPAPLFAGSDAPRADGMRRSEAAPAPRRPGVTNEQQPAQRQARESSPERGQAASAPTPSRPQSIGDLLNAPLPPARPDAIDRGDSIGALLRDDNGPSVTGSTNPQQAPAADPRVLQAQQALNAIGYGDLAEDGLMGPMTREAIIRFERDQGLEPSGRLEAGTARALSRASGISLD
jgi:hypothetical protein